MGLMSDFYNADGSINMDAFNQAAGDARTQTALEYPVLGRAQSQAVIGYSPVNKYGAFLEYYPAQESENPYKGQVYQEVYDRLLKGSGTGADSLKNALAADMTHWTGGRDQNGNENDPTYMGMQRAFQNTFTDRDLDKNEKAWQDVVSGGEYGGTKDQWLENSRTPAYIRGAVFNQWNGYNGSTPEQQQILSNIKAYLTGKAFQNSGGE